MRRCHNVRAGRAILSDSGAVVQPSSLSDVLPPARHHVSNVPGRADAVRGGANSAHLRVDFGPTGAQHHRATSGSAGFRLMPANIFPCSVLCECCRAIRALETAFAPRPTSKLAARHDPRKLCESVFSIRYAKRKKRLQAMIENAAAQFPSTTASAWLLRPAEIRYAAGYLSMAARGSRFLASPDSRHWRLPAFGDAPDSAVTARPTG